MIIYQPGEWLSVSWFHRKRNSSRIDPEKLLFEVKAIPGSFYVIKLELFRFVIYSVSNMTYFVQNNGINKIFVTAGRTIFCGIISVAGRASARTLELELEKVHFSEKFIEVLLKPVFDFGVICMDVVLWYVDWHDIDI